MVRSCVSIIVPSPKSQFTVRTSFGKNPDILLVKYTVAHLSGLSTELFKMTHFQLPTLIVNSLAAITSLFIIHFTSTVVFHQIRNTFFSDADVVVFVVQSENFH